MYVLGGCMFLLIPLFHLKKIEKVVFFMVRKLSRPKNYKEKVPSISLSKVASISYAHKMLTVTENRARKYKSYNNELIKFLGDVDVHQLKVTDVYDFINYLKLEKRQYEGVAMRKNWDKIGLNNKTINDYIMTISVSIRLMYELEYLDDKNYRNPFEKIKKLKEEESRPRQVAQSDLQKFLKVLDTDYYADLRMKVALYTMLESYCRVNELVNLSVDDIDFENSLITFKKTKNSNFRVVPISKKVIKMLQNLINENRGFNTNRVFVTVTGKELTTNQMRRYFKISSERAGLKEYITPHQIRHTAAIEAVKNGLDIRSLQKMLGHSRIETTAIYLNVYDEALVHAQSKFSPLSILDEK